MPVDPPAPIVIRQDSDPMNPRIEYDKNLYTVVGYWADYNQPYVGHFVAPSVLSAMKQAFSDNLVIVEVFSGFQVGLGEHDTCLGSDEVQRNDQNL